MADGRPSSSSQASADQRVGEILTKQRKFFRSGATLPREFREDQLRALQAVLKKRERQIFEALNQDLGRSEGESFIAEVGYMNTEIRHTLKHLGRWMKARGSFSPLAVAVSRSYVHYQPLGQNLIIAPWNYPVQLAIAPLIGAIAAGNTAVVKPSELAPASSKCLAEIIADAFSEEYVAVVEGGVDTSQKLLAEKWDHIFFTGGTNVGKIVARAAAENLSRCTLELGGKSPTIVTDSANLDVAAKRITLGKFFNAGQTCIAPDYLLVQESVHDGLLQRIQSAIKEFYGDDPHKSPEYSRIINDRHFQRLEKLIDKDKVVTGGETAAEERYIAPTVMRDVTMDDKVMGDEIFGPLMPIMKIKNLDEAIDIVHERPNPLALYLFTDSSDDERNIIDRVSFGGGCINNATTHFLDPDLPFGGIGASGLGAYHGVHSFEVFSHRKSVMKTANFLDPSIKYPPYAEKLGTLRKLLG